MDGPRASPYDGSLPVLGRIEGSPRSVIGFRRFLSTPPVRLPIPGFGAARGFNDRGSRDPLGTGAMERGQPNPPPNKIETCGPHL
eukprot:scaffold2941_cov499-Pavlova_lutheri.AAC.1